MNAPNLHTCPCNRFSKNNLFNTIFCLIFSRSKLKVFSSREIIEYKKGVIKCDPVGSYHYFKPPSIVHPFWFFTKQICLAGRSGQMDHYGHWKKTVPQASSNFEPPWVGFHHYTASLNSMCSKWAKPLIKYL